MSLDEMIAQAENGAPELWEQIARQLLSKRKPKKAKSQDVYAWALADFGDGIRIVVGGYGLTEKQAAEKARRRRALVFSGRWLDPHYLSMAQALPVAVLPLTQENAEPVRLACMRERVELWGNASWEIKQLPEAARAERARLDAELEAYKAAPPLGDEEDYEDCHYGD